MAEYKAFLRPPYPRLGSDKLLNILNYLVLPAANSHFNWHASVELLWPSSKLVNSHCTLLGLRLTLRFGV